MRQDLVTIATFEESTRANLALQELERAGIRGYLLNEATSMAVYWRVPVELQVATPEVEAARRALGREPAKTVTAPEECPRCGAREVEPAQAGVLDSIYLFTCLACTFTPKLRPAWRCGKCKAKWRQEPLEGEPLAQR